MSTYDPDNFIQLSGELFEEVQLSGVFKDSKTFVDSVPKSDPDEILEAYKELKQDRQTPVSRRPAPWTNISNASGST